MRLLRGAATPLLAASVLLLGSACAAIFRQPEVRLEGVRLGGISLRGATLVARLHITNPNGYGVEASALTYLLELQDPDSAGRWVRLTEGTIDQAIAVSANSADVVEIPFEFSYSELGSAVRTLLDRGTFEYRVSGRIDVARPLSKGVRYRRTGQVTLQGVR